ncbi:hypothetical protein J3E72DRAFT_365024 [Bipolaris maydis]|uniref:uncharacterized protein n=1 Tax=Cochliobolus heterostrophus TaxID=5016 RepID=UPI0024DAC994|nr:hypothetical protein J3E74DRAFT_388253 [Bipolaris maydis]KAJ6192283.1 hypothetical protein J3E72DRAFT_365024 [Bipolaris maydis]KAJ6203758.1 hypothetical protein PSV09DRAFT_2354054 [Bipolaris maydis]KAJ6267431.1 hypothetical protein PSV08DRAFT_325859 [Bipolaris maydis]KAJ6267617.1 hypothetical protein PSV08DRAFT_326653 [Bipolaris maydis]
MTASMIDSSQHTSKDLCNLRQTSASQCLPQTPRAAHARLYCFAHLRLIMPLKALTLHKMHKTLMNFKLYTKRVGDIIELARYAYSNPDLPDRSDDGTIDELRKLVVEYIVCEIDIIGKCDEFVKYMEEGGEFVGDFWRMVKDYVA